MILLSQVAMRCKLSTAEIKALDFLYLAGHMPLLLQSVLWCSFLVMMGYFPDSRPAIYVGITNYCLSYWVKPEQSLGKGK